MSDQYILRIGNDGKPISLLSFDAQSSCQKHVVTQWSDVALKAKPLTLLLPGNWLYLTKTNIPSKSSDVLEKSIPFAIEEELSNEVEDNYFAFRQTADGQQDVIAIEKPQLNNIGAAIRDHQLHVTAIYSEFDWLPKPTNAIVLWFEETYALLRFGSDEVMRVSHQQVNQLIPIFKGDIKHILTNHPGDFELNDLAVDNSLDEVKCKEHLLTHHAIDLYLEEIKEGNEHKQTDSWQKVVVLGLVVVFSWLGIQLYQMSQLSSQIDGLKQQQQQIFSRAFTDAAPSELIDPYAAIKSRMQLQNNQSSDNQSILQDIVQSIGSVAQSIKSIQVNGIRLVNQQMEIQVSAPNITTVNDFHQQLQLSANDYRVQIGVNELSEDNLYNSIITVVPR
ncbi:type II secretion system protein GspL [Marinicella litoralis]|uniref:Type II secretion system protein L n=1 Tax=Marinicella litoralis TaxID=644220 RepID=A0A4V3DHT9_9GAMM|nr:type II secretion system protein GspL [Marinicella litoralis]TDR19501.1 type II secretion system protein L [Marinicella litoralis]